MNKLCLSNNFMVSTIPSRLNRFVSDDRTSKIRHQEDKPRPNFTSFAAKPGGLSLVSACKTCDGKGAIKCPGCKGTGKNKKNGNIFERWKCYDCQGFGLKSCPKCGKGGLTPEQRGER